LEREDEIRSSFLRLCGSATERFHGESSSNFPFQSTVWTIRTEPRLLLDIGRLGIGMALSIIDIQTGISNISGLNGVYLKEAGFSFRSNVFSCIPTCVNTIYRKTII
jgi:hypothetical protein